MHNNRDAAQNKYLKIIDILEGIIKELIGKNDFLVKDRETLLREN